LRSSRPDTRPACGLHAPKLCVADTNADCDGKPNCHSYSNSDSYSYCYSYRHCYCHGDLHTDAYCNANSYAHTDPARYSNAAIRADAQGATNAAAETIVGTRSLIIWELASVTREFPALGDARKDWGAHASRVLAIASSRSRTFL
jgi:hypothetical protein